MKLNQETQRNNYRLDNDFAFDKKVTNHPPHTQPDAVNDLLWKLSSRSEQQQLVAEDQFQSVIESEVAQAAASPAAFNKLLTESFGNNFDVSAAEDLRRNILQGNTDALPKITLLDSAELQDALGAYDAESDTIYLNRNIAGTEQGRQTLVEEFGHAIDARVNSSDASGDEGAIFRHILGGEPISQAQMAALRSESDEGTLSINGQSVEVEFRAENEYTGPGSSPGTGGLPESTSEYTGPGSSPGTGGLPESTSEYTGPGSSPGTGGLPESKSEYTGPGSSPGTGGLPESTSEYTGPGSSPGTGGLPESTSEYTGPGSSPGTGGLPESTRADEILTEYQVEDDEIVEWKPKLGGLPWVRAFWQDPVQLTATEAQLLDGLATREGLNGLNNFKNIRNDAFEESESRFPPTVREFQGQPTSGNFDHTDAYRHTYWSARLAAEFGPEFATAFTQAHEGVPGNPADMEAMDLYNNELGIRIATENPDASPDELADLVQEAVDNGEAVVIDGNNDLVFSDEVAVGATGIADDAPLPGEPPAEADLDS